MESPLSRQEGTVTDVNMPFWSIVRLMVKWAFASIPALVILFLVGVACSFAFTLIVMSWAPLMRGIGARPAAEVKAEERAKTAEAERKAAADKELIAAKAEVERAKVAVAETQAALAPPVPAAPAAPKTKHVIRTEFVMASGVTRLYHRPGCQDIQGNMTQVAVTTAEAQGIHAHAGCVSLPKDIHVSELWY